MIGALDDPIIPGLARSFEQWPNFVFLLVFPKSFMTDSRLCLGFDCVFPALVARLTISFLGMSRRR